MSQKHKAEITETNNDIILPRFSCLGIILSYIGDFLENIPYIYIFYDFMKSGTPVNTVNFAGYFIALPIVNASLLGYGPNIAPTTKFLKS